MEEMKVEKSEPQKLETENQEKLVRKKRVSRNDNRPYRRIYLKTGSQKLLIALAQDFETYAKRVL